MLLNGVHIVQQGNWLVEVYRPSSSINKDKALGTLENTYDGTISSEL